MDQRKADIKTLSVRASGGVVNRLSSVARSRKVHTYGCDLLFREMAVAVCAHERP